MAGDPSALSAFLPPPLTYHHHHHHHYHYYYYYYDYYYHYLPTLTVVLRDLSAPQVSPSSYTM